MKSTQCGGSEHHEGPPAEGVARRQRGTSATIRAVAAVKSAGQMVRKMRLWSGSMF